MRDGIKYPEISALRGTMKKGPRFPATPEDSFDAGFPAKKLALRELEAATRLGAAILLALDDPAVAGQEPGGLDRRAQHRLELGQRLGNAVLDRARLAREAAALDGRDNIVLFLAASDLERLVDDEAQCRAREIDFLIAAIDRDLAAARLDPDAGNRVLAATGGIGAALGVELLRAQRRGRSSGCGRRLGRFGGNRSCAGQVLEVGQAIDGIGIGHHAPTLFLRFMEATSSGWGWVPPCGWSVPA
jgi:hypothetical protein